MHTHCPSLCLVRQMQLVHRSGNLARIQAPTTGVAPPSLMMLSAEVIKAGGALLDGKTPRSIELTRQENRILRIPDTHMMIQQQQSLHDMLQGIYEVRTRTGRYRG
jgi:hypothetical protein